MSFINKSDYSFQTLIYLSQGITNKKGVASLLAHIRRDLSEVGLTANVWLSTQKKPVLLTMMLHPDYPRNVLPTPTPTPMPNPTPTPTPMPSPIMPPSPLPNPKPIPSPILPREGDSEEEYKAKQLVEILKSLGGGGVATLDEERVREIIREESPKPVIHHIHFPDSKIEVSGQHWKYPLILSICKAGYYPYIFGGAGAGKTHLAHSIAQDLGLEFEIQAYGIGMSKSDINGYTDAGGTYRDTPFIRAFRDGKFILHDEYDRAMDVQVCLNSAYANGYASTMQGRIDKHICHGAIFSGNNSGDGADERYSSACEIDKSAVDRLFYISFPYDIHLEKTLGGMTAPAQKVIDLQMGGILTPDQWGRGVDASREASERIKSRTMVTPRSTIVGGRLCSSIGADWLIEGLITRGCDTDTHKTLTDAFWKGVKQ
jgi:AAA domain (dynein-related subfamily)